MPAAIANSRISISGAPAEFSDSTAGKLRELVEFAKCIISDFVPVLC